MKISWPLLILMCSISYLSGSIPSGVLMSRLAGMGDITLYGSGNTGATNVLRVLGPKQAIVVLTADVLKGFAPVYFALKYSNLGNLGPFLIGVLAIVGHNWSVFLGFKGGKGVATTAGVALALFPKIIILSFVVFVICVSLSKYVSLGSLIAVWAGFLYSLSQEFTTVDRWAVFILAATVTLRHKSNIQRLVAGTELRLGQKGEKN